MGNQLNSRDEEEIEDFEDDNVKQEKGNQQLRKKRYKETDFEKIKLLGKGNFGEVFLVVNKETYKMYVMKVMKKEKILKGGEELIESIKAERILLAGVKNPFIIYLRASFSDETKLFFILDYISGGDLSHHLKREINFPEDRVKFLAAEILLGLKYLHRNGILHRDLKLPNILITKEGHIRITDFGLSYFFKSRGKNKPIQACGSPQYVAPEIIENLKLKKRDRVPYNHSIDIWSFGILLFEMLFGYTPFEPLGIEDNYLIVCEEEFEIPKKPKISDECKDLIRKLTIKNPKKRIGYKGIKEIMSHPFFDQIDFKQLYNRKLDPPFKPVVQSSLDVRNFSFIQTSQGSGKESENEDDLSSEDYSTDSDSDEEKKPKKKPTGEVFGSFGFTRDDKTGEIMKEVDDNLKKMYKEKVQEEEVKEESLKLSKEEFEKLKKKKKKIEKKK